jgi:hypothetical protein
MPEIFPASGLTRHNSLTCFLLSRKREAMRYPYLTRLLLSTLVLTLFAALAALLLPPDGRLLPRRADLHMYLVMLDRFADGDRSNNNANGMSDAQDPLAVQGGDLRGLALLLPQNPPSPSPGGTP